MFKAEAIAKTGSALVKEMVGPAGSTRVGVLSRAYACADDEPCSSDELLLELWAPAAAAAMPANRHKKMAKGKYFERTVLNVMGKPCLQV
jgi:hypothetical protein